MTDRFFWNLISIFAILNALIFGFKGALESGGNNIWVLAAGNALLAAVSAFSYNITRRGVSQDNNLAFVRSVYASTLAKLMLSLVGIGIYVLVNRKNVSKTTIFMLMGFYFVYTVFETVSLQKLLRRKQ
ncbi:hypothetical protein MKQ70_19395 [Chitinophaga sedimenti]|uniref:hypothetical protein n=1 Tax=Chitinophaga sedimenti TaxID=2033606 RepID=UPI0020044F8F|nr:hypothetical protein [Chitinophaga sedimenti]MCK7557053.1 hypothetical protein [Chitinophaga sedimenti]